MADPCSISASIITILQVAATINHYLKEVRGGSRDRIRLREEIRSTVCLLEILNDRAEDAESSERDLSSIRSLSIVNGPLEQLRKSLDQLAELLNPGGRLKKLVQPFTWPLTRTDANAILSSIERQKALFSLAIQNDTIELSRAIKSQVDEINQKVTELCIYQSNNNKTVLDQERRDIIDWISLLTFWQKQSDVFCKRTEGTGTWFIESSAFQKWVNGKEDVLWCPGIPGAGKTILTSVVVDYLQRNFASADYGLAFIYCNYKEQNAQTFINLISSLVRQLVNGLSTIPEEIYSLYRRYEEKENTRPNLSEYLDLLNVVVGQYPMVFIVIDALDECSEVNGTRSKFASELYRLVPKIRLFCTSRGLLDIENQFKSSSCLEIHAADADIRTHLVTRIQQETRLSKHVQTDPTLLSSILNTIIDAANGMFLLAQMHFESIATKHNRKAIRSALANLPSALNETYEETLRRIHSQNSDDVLLAERVLSWISFSVRPLTVSELQHAVAIMDHEADRTLDDEDLPDEDILISVCAGLVKIDEKSRIIQLVHYTTQEYFERNCGKLFTEAQGRIGSACILYLSLDVFEAGPCTNDKATKKRFDNYPLLNYASQNWAHHIRGASELSYMSFILAVLHNEGLSACASQASSVSVNDIPGPYRERSQSFPRKTPSLLNASKAGLSAIVAFLIGRGDSIEGSDDFGVTPLIGAVEFGHMEVTRQLIAEGAQINAKTLDGSTALSMAAQMGHVRIVELLLEEGANLEATDRYLTTALHRAALNGHYAVVNMLLDRGASVDMENLSKSRALDFAVRGGHSSVAELLIENASLKGKDAGVDSALFFATAESNLAFVELLLNKGASPSSRIYESDKETTFHFAAKHAELKVVKLLIDHGFDPQVRSIYDHTPLHYASSSGRSNVVDLLLKSGADVNAQTSTGNTPLHYAIEGNEENDVVEATSIEVIILLLDNGADVSYVNSNGQTALHQSAMKGYGLVVQLLLRNGAELESKDTQNQTAIQAAAACGHDAVVEILRASQAHTDHSLLQFLLAGARLRNAAAQGDEETVQGLLENGAALVADSAGETALHKAAYHGHTKIVEVLLRNGINVNAVTFNPLGLREALNVDSSLSGRTALHLAAEMGHTIVMGLLIDNNAHINAREKRGRTPLLSTLRLCSTRRNRGLESMRLLLDHKADFSITDEIGGSPLYRAVLTGDEDVVRLLLSYGAGVETEIDGGREVLNRAIDSQHSHIIKLLSSYGFKVGV